MTKDEAERAILAIPGVTSYRETQNDLRRTIGWRAELEDGRVIADVMNDDRERHEALRSQFREYAIWEVRRLVLGDGGTADGPKVEPAPEVKREIQASREETAEDAPSRARANAAVMAPRLATLDQARVQLLAAIDDLEGVQRKTAILALRAYLSAFATDLMAAHHDREPPGSVLNEQLDWLDQAIGG
jgi:hypothetical protein